MSWIPDRYRELRSLLRPDRIEDDVDEELALHVALRAADLELAGLRPADARDEALRRFGDMERVRAKVCAIEVSIRREQRRMEIMDVMLRDTRIAVRSLLRSPAFAAVAVVTLGLGIGANTAIFSVVNAVLMRPIPAEELDRLVVVREDIPGLNLLDVDLAPAEVMDLAGRRDVFEAVTGYRRGDRTLTGYGEPQRLSVASTLGDFAGVFRVVPHVGRLHRPDESTEGAHRVAVLSHGLWQQLSGGDPSYVGRTIQLNALDFEVIGVMPPGFRYPDQTQVWVPLPFTTQLQQPQMRGNLWMSVVARVRPDVSPAQLTAQLDAEASAWNETYHGGSPVKVLRATGFIEYTAGPLRLILLVLMGAVVFVLLIAAANIGSLQLVRAAGRSREIAIRGALGAGRGRILIQLVTETVLLALAGGALGLWIGRTILGLFAAWGPARQMNLTEIPLDATVLAFTALVTLITAVTFGTLPALRASTVQPQDALRETSRGSSSGLARKRLLQASVVVQVALALVLLLGSALMIRTLSSLLSTDPGFQPDGVMTAQVSIPGATYDSPERTLAFFDALLERTRALPGITDASLVWGLPFTDQRDSSPFTIANRPELPGDPERHAEARIVSAGFFRTMRIPLLSGTDFDGTETVDGQSVVIIDETFARQFFPDEDPVGQQITHYTGALSTIIGVAARIDHQQVGDVPKATSYLSYRQLPWGGNRTLAVRSELPADAVTGMLRTALAELDPNVPLYDVQTMRARLEQSLGPRRLAMLALACFALLALLLATLGVYGVMRYSTNQRTREIGIRVAVGAEPRDVLTMVIRQGAAITALGLLAGTIAAFWLTQLMSGMLFGVSPRDPLAFASAVGLLAVVSIASSWLPAWRATRIDPVEALRAD